MPEPILPSPSQLERLRSLLGICASRSAFYQRKAREAGLDLAALAPEDFQRLPTTRKEELAQDQEEHPPYGTVLCEPLERYTRLHLTSGTKGRPLRWLDTPESWAWWKERWQGIYRAAGLGPADRLFFPFSFGPFIGFWAAFEAAQDLGTLVLAGGGERTEERIRNLLEFEATAVVCTPTYALRLAEAARLQGLDLAASPVRITLHAGEPGASLPSVRRRIEEAWGARCFDHAGATEVGPWGFGCTGGEEMHLDAEEFLAEVLEPEEDRPVEPDGRGVLAGELVLTPLGRLGSPVLRYRTGDRVRLVQRSCPCGREGPMLLGGILGRVDDMFVVRGVNVFPSAVENLVRAFPEVQEFDACVRRQAEMAELEIQVELEPGLGEEEGRALGARLEERLHRELHLRARVECVPAGSLPRYELKARRFRFEGA